MSNRINDAIQEVIAREGITYRDIAKRCGISEQTLHSTRNRKSIGRVGIDVFLKIAHGLGMTAEELYYGKPATIQQASTSTDERRLLDAWHGIDPITRPTILSMVEAASGVEKQSPSRAVGA